MSLVVEERQEGILLRGVGSAVAKLSWEDYCRDDSKARHSSTGVAVSAEVWRS